MHANLQNCGDDPTNVWQITEFGQVNPYGSGIRKYRLALNNWKSPDH